MAKRLRDTEIWKKKWYRLLPPQMKCVWDYLCDNCDHAGIIDIDVELMQFQIGGPEFTLEDILSTFGDRITQLKENKYLLPDFITFQYGQLNPENRVHASVISRLEKHGSWKGLGSPIQGAKEKEKDKDKDKVNVDYSINPELLSSESILKSRKIKRQLQDRWIETYKDAQFISHELNKAEDWLVANQHKAPKRDYGRFLNNWLGRAWDQHRKSLSANPSASGGGFSSAIDRGFGR